MFLQIYEGSFFQMFSYYIYIYVSFLQAFYVLADTGQNSELMLTRLIVSDNGFNNDHKQQLN